MTTPRTPGRPRMFDSRQKKYTIRLPADMADTVRGLGGGNFSAGVRHLVEMYERKETYRQEDAVTANHVAACRATKRLGCAGYSRTAGDRSTHHE